MFLLDTNILIYFFEDKDPKVAEYFVNGTPVISVLSRTELLAGVEKKKESVVLEFLRTLPSIPISNEIADGAADLIRKYPHLKRRLPDALIAVTCLIHELRLVTANVQDFDRIKGLKMQAFVPSARVVE